MASLKHTVHRKAAKRRERKQRRAKTDTKRPLSNHRR